MKIAFNPSTVAALTTPPDNKDITFDLRGHNIFARGVKFYGTDTNTWRDIKINNVSIGSNVLDLRNGSNTTLTNTDGVVTINSTWRPVVDNLTSNSTTSSLSANQGRILAGLINGKSDSDHNHDGRYLRLSGQDTMQGNLYLHSYGPSYIGRGLGDKSGADFTEANIVIRSWWGISFKANDDVVRTYIDTRTGNIGTKGVLNAIGAVIQGRVYNNGDDEGIIIKPYSNGCAGLILGTHNGERSVFYLLKGDPLWRYNNGSTSFDIYHPKKPGIIALTSDIPSKDSWNYDDRYLKLTGGWMSGDINFGGDNKIYWGRNTDSASISFKNDGDGDANSYMSFVTSDNGNEYFRWSHNTGSTDTEWMALRSDGLRVRGTKVSLEGHSHNDLYYTKVESNAKYITDIATSVNKLTFTRNGSNIARNITVNIVYSQGQLPNIPNEDATTKASPGLLIYDSYEQAIGTNAYSSVLSINTGGTIQIAGNWGDEHARNLYWRSQSDRNVTKYPWKSWRTILDSENYSFTLDSRYYTESEVNSLLDAKLNRQNLSYGNWNPRGWNLAADYYYNGGNISISENSGQIHVSIDGAFWQNEGRYRVLDTSDIGDIRNSVTLHQYLLATNATWYPLVWGGASHNNTSDSTGAVYKSYDKLSWQTSSQTLYATNIQTNNIKNLSIGGGIYWNPNVESTSDSTDAASITLVRSGVAGGTTLVLSQQKDTNDTIQFQTNPAARLYHNSYPILTTQNTYVNNNKGYINGSEITQVNNSDKVDNRHAISTTPNTGIIYKAAIYTAYSLTSYWVRLASIPSINQNNEFVATIHVQSGHSGFGRNAILLVYLRGGASSYLAKGFNICCNSKYDPIRFRLYYKDSDKTSEIWYNTVGQWDGIITTVISQSSEGSLYEGLTLYSGIITAVQTPSMSTYLSAQVSTITDNISGNASTATKLQTARSIWGQSFDGTSDVNGTIYINNGNAQIRREGSSQVWVNGRIGALLRETSVAGYHTLWSLKTTNGSWDFGEYNAGSDWNNIPVLSYVTDSDYNSGNNVTTYQIKFPLASGTVALTSQIINLRSLGNQNCQTGRTQSLGDVYSYNTIIGNTGSPTTYTSVIGFGRGIAGTVEIAGGWCNTNLYWRSLRDCCEDWYSWRTVLDSNNYTEFMGNYYWANIKISTSSSSTTSPIVSNLTATNSIRMNNISLEHTDEINNITNGGIHLNYRNSGNVSLCYGGGNVSIGDRNPSYKLDVAGQMRASGFHHESVNSDNYILLAGGGYKPFGGSESNPIFLGYLNLDHGDDGTVSSSFSCLGYSVPFTYTRGGNYCRIIIPNTIYLSFYVKAAIASVNYSGGGMDTWVGTHKSAGAWWLHCYAYGWQEVRVKGFRQASNNNDSWWGGNPLYAYYDGANRITVCIFGYVKFK